MSFQSRLTPLAPIAVAASGAAARGLAIRLLAHVEANGSSLSGVRAGDVLVVLGPTDALPWAPGVTYLGADPDAPGLLLPTTLAPTVAGWLFARAVLKREPAVPVAVLPFACALVSVAEARTIDAASLRAFLGALA